jgi:hypothetical protein
MLEHQPGGVESTSREAHDSRWRVEGSRLWAWRITYGMLLIAAIVNLGLFAVYWDKQYLVFGLLAASSCKAIHEYVEETRRGKHIPFGLVVAIVGTCAAVYVMMRISR